ncbi:hypothetical protein LPJ38_12995 [Bradyrhizobium daqingense]|uniref:Uncharacterized protein n=1 Tax=Bradyrhizobium daqingense TaxID=993502 RepID=A0A562KR79_9BRAD|nr:MULTISPECIES: hypothetical protein [Bradyrhizobium]MDQ8731677.1 hypothetical protein [Bradyrhizobium sp. LHD-71]TWH97900.1 hypothetical protein IQ17_06138 [Bradyrhizobium daqingense]UFS91595.1 hypothetical protein LPJ38_12995 [Bradyrhizobium daqingense]
MSELGIQLLMLPLAGIHMTPAHNEVTGWIELARALGNSYRLASSGLGLGALYGRFIFAFCKASVTAVAR